MRKTDIQCKLISSAINPRSNFWHLSLAPSFMTDSDLIKPNDTLSGQVRHWIQPNITLVPTTTSESDTGSKFEYIAKWDGEPEVDSYLQCAPGPGP